MVFWSLSRYNTPQFNSHLTWVFKLIGWNQRVLGQFSEVFESITDGKKKILDLETFIIYFSFDRFDYGVDKCFRYFNIRHSGEIDFLEFMIGAWNSCPYHIDILIQFSFEMYDLNDDCELSLPEIEKIPINKEIIHDMIAYAEDNGGVLDMQSFAFYAIEHSTVLLPIFKIQRVSSQEQHHHEILKLIIKVLNLLFW